MEKNWGVTPSVTLNLEKKDSLSADRLFFLLFGSKFEFYLSLYFFICLFSIE